MLLFKKVQDRYKKGKREELILGNGLHERIGTDNGRETVHILGRAYPQVNFDMTV